MSDDYLDDKDKERLEYTQSIREQILREYFKDGIEIPSNKKEADLIVSLLDGMDRTTLTKAKLKADKEQNATNSMMLETVVKIMEQIKPNEPFIIEDAPVRELPPNLEVDDLEIVEGEDYIGIENENYEQFMNKMRKKLHGE